MGIITTNTELVVTVCWCGVEHAVPRSLYDMQKRQRDDDREQVGIYCPSGHRWTFAGEPRSKELERQIAAKQAALDQERAARRDADAALERERKKARRVAKGVCPCCTRSFTNLRRHMQTKHPEVAGEKGGPQ
jgi:hypothetical protein